MKIFLSFSLPRGAVSVVLVGVLALVVASSTEYDKNILEKFHCETMGDRHDRLIPFTLYE
jgi:hypothetical protein